MISNMPVAFRLITLRLYYCFFRQLSRSQPNSIKIGDSVLLIKSVSGVNIRELKLPRQQRQRERKRKRHLYNKHLGNSDYFCEVIYEMFHILNCFIAQLVRASHQYREVTGSNPVEVLTFSGFCSQLLKLRSKLR